MVNKGELLKEINETSFAINDLTLYLDTHPGCKNGLDQFTALHQRRKKAMADFEQNFYPLSVDCIQNLNSGVWPWADAKAPAPWEGCANYVEL